MSSIAFIGLGNMGAPMLLRLGLSSFKHVGLFPEQDSNWKFIFDKTRGLKTQTPKVLNMFAYTGAATLAAKAAGADVTHLDSVKQVNFWARDNMEASGLDNVRWIVEDAMKYARREVKRGNTYNGIILDPPAYGRGPNGEKWQLEDELNELIKLCHQMLDKTDYFLVINLYSLGFSAMILDNLMRLTFKEQVKNEQLGEIYLHDRGERRLPLGTFFRFTSVER